jgi:hypothetical protein
MPEWFDNVLFGATLPFRAVTEVALFVPTIATTIIAETAHKIVDPDHDWDATRDYGEARNVWGKVAGVGLGVGAIVASGGVGLVVAGAAATNSASNINQKCEKILDGNCSSSEELNLRLGMAIDGCGLVGNAAKLGIDGMGLSPDILGPLRLVSKTVGVPMSLVMKFTPQAHKKYQEMSAVEQALEAASMGISLYKFQELMAELSELY